MKKSIALILTIVLAVSALAGCAGTTVVVGECTCPVEHIEQVPVEVESIPAATDDTLISAGAAKTGLAVIPSVSKSVSATAEAAGAAEYDVTVVAVTVNDEGVIQSCAIDSIPATVNFDTTGTITTDLTAPVQTKNEKGENYGMVAWGGAIAEWDQQVAALARYAEGKTVEQLKNGDIDMTTGMAKDGTDLKSSATIYLGGYVSAIEAAVNNAQHLGAETADELILTTMNSLGSSTSADAENPGNAQLDADIVALTRKNGIITSCYIDSLQAKIAFDTTGTITTDLTAPIQTKNELGENYGMVAWGGAIAEWNQQAASFAQYITGKTAADVAGIAIEPSTKPAEGTDLRNSVTISIGGFQALIAKALQ